MEEAFRIYGYHYERKPRQFDSQAIDISKLFTNEYVAQAYLAVVLRAPSDARARKYKVWGELHAKIFSGSAVEPYIIAAVLAWRVSEWLRQSAHMTAASEIERLIAKRGSFHVARIGAYLWRGSDIWNVTGDQLKEQITQLETQPEVVASHFGPALDMLAEIVCKTEEYSGDVDKALKSAALDKDIDKRFHKLSAKLPLP